MIIVVNFCSCSETSLKCKETVVSIILTSQTSGARFNLQNIAGQIYDNATNVLRCSVN